MESLLLELAKYAALKVLPGLHHARATKHGSSTRDLKPLWGPPPGRRPCCVWRSPFFGSRFALLQSHLGLAAAMVVFSWSVFAAARSVWAVVRSTSALWRATACCLVSAWETSGAIWPLPAAEAAAASVLLSQRIFT